MFVFDNVLTAGTVLVRQQIESQNFVTLVSGWVVRQDGTAEFQNIIARGDITANALHVTDGTRIIDISTVTGIATIGLTSAGLAVPGKIQVGSSGELVLTSAALDAAHPTLVNQIYMLSGVFGVTPGQMILTASTDGAGGTGLIWLDGDVSAPQMTPVVASDNTLRQTTNSTYNNLGTVVSVTCPYPRSGAVMVSIAADLEHTTDGVFAIMSFEIHDTNAGGALRAGPGDSRAVLLRRTGANDRKAMGWSGVLTGLPTTGTLYAQLMGRSSDNLTNANFRSRILTVSPCL